MFNFSKRSLLAFFYTALFLCCIAPGFVLAQSYVETFGQNRIQHRKMDWKFFDTRHFRVYHYDKAGRQLGRYVAEEAENNIKVIEKKMNGQFPTRFNIVLYNSYDDFQQTNIGLTDQSQISSMTISGTWNLVGDKLVVYHTGKHTDLRRQIEAGMARVVIERMIFGESFKKMAKTALLINLPDWVTDGFIAYLVDGWDTKANSEWKRLLDAQPKVGFHELSEMYPEIAGKAFWKFVSDNYGQEKVKNLLSDMQARTALNKSMRDSANLGLKVKKAYDSCIKYYKACYALDLKNQEMPDSAKGLISLKVPKGTNTIVRNIMVSPSGTDIAYTVWHDGEYSVYSQKTSGDQVRSTLLEGGLKDLDQEIDPNYPLMAWSSAGNKLAIMHKKGSKVSMRIYNAQKNRIENIKIPPNRFDRVLSMCFMQDDDKMVFSAVKKSQTDLYSFTIRGAKMVNITDDAWDDIEPVFVSGGSRKGVLFLSNRPKANLNVPVGVNELPTGPMNVFFYNATTQRSELLRCTNVTTGRISQPIQYGADNFAYLYDANGIQNKYVVMFARDEHNMDTPYSVPITNYNTSIISHQFNLAVDEVADVIQVKDKYRVYFHKRQMPTDSTPGKHLVPTTLSYERPESPKTMLDAFGARRELSGKGTDEPSVFGSGSVGAFQSEFQDTVTVPKTKKKKKHFDDTPVVETTEPADGDSSTLSVINDSAYVKMKPSQYRASFKPDMFNVRIDNSVLFTQYQSFANNAGMYQNPGISALTTINMNELMENYKITAGFQVPVDLNSTAYFLKYSNTKRKLDWGVLMLRTQRSENKYVEYSDSFGNSMTKQQLFKNVSNIVQGDISYPFSKVRSFRFKTAIRQDHLIQKSQDYLSLNYEVPNTNLFWSLSRAEYVFDNTISPILNIRRGTRFKVYGEYMYQLNGTKQSCYNLGLDFRTYHKIYKNAIWANRVAYGHSDGTAMVQYQLGGTDNWISPKTANNFPVNGDYGFIALATSLRGYNQGARKGNNFAVMTTEFRLPLLTTFIKQPIQSGTLKNLQFCAFADGGSAWYGFLPSADNLDATYLFPTRGAPPTNGNAIVVITVPNANGFALGYGAGLRTTMFGYFVRFDCAWNIEGSKTPIKYLSIGTDF